MATSSKRAQHGASSDPEETGAFGAAGAFADMSRQQMAAASEALSVFFRASEALQQAQLHMGQRAALLHSQAAENIRKASSPMELASIQSTLLLYEFQEGMRYWQELMGASAKAGAEIMRRAPQDTSETASAASPGAAMVGAAMSAAAPMADAFQQMFTAPLKAAAQATQAH